MFLSPMPLTSAFAKERATRLDSVLGPGEAARMHEIEHRWGATSDDDLPSLCRESWSSDAKLHLVDPSHFARTRGNASG